MILIALAGVGAGAINAVVGSGRLITFPTLVALGNPPVTATISNAVGLVAGACVLPRGRRRCVAPAASTGEGVRNGRPRAAHRGAAARGLRTPDSGVGASARGGCRAFGRP